MSIKTTANLAITTLLVLAAPGAHAGGSLCKFNTVDYAPFDQDTSAKCIVLRTKGNAADSSQSVWELTPSTRFATLCPVSSVKLGVHSGTACSRVASSALKDGDSVRVDEWAAGKFQLVIQRNHRSVFHYSQGAVLLEPVQVKLDSVRTIGYRADNVKIYAESPTDPPLSVSYYVYLRTAVQGNHFIRWYDIEVFNDDAECRKEIPGSVEAATEVVSCPIAKRVRKVVTTMQLPAGGGGEDPPG